MEYFFSANEGFLLEPLANAGTSQGLVQGRARHLEVLELG